MKVNEIFYSLQGEGARAGQPTLFIRLSGCDLSCGFCDTEFKSGTEVPDSLLLERVKQNGCEWVTWTGGEPMLQLRSETVNLFKANGLKQSLETNGGHPVPFDIDWLVVSPKVSEHVLARNFPNGVDELRYAWHCGKLSVPVPDIPASHKYLSPIFDGNEQNLANLKHCVALCKKNPEWRLSIQQHKLWNIL